MGEFLKKAVEILGSFKLAFWLLILLGLLTFVGTLEQQNLSLYDVQAKYFESIVLFYDVGFLPFPIPLLGGYLLLTVFFFNILTGGILRLRKGKSTVGIFISHLGIIFLLLGSFVEHQFSTKGHLTLWAPEKFEDLNGNGVFDRGERFADYNKNGRYDDGESGAEYKSSNEWEVVITEVKADGSAREHVIDEGDFDGLADGGSSRHTHAGLPFDLVLSGYARNSQPRPVKAAEARQGIGVDGFVLQVMDPVGPGNRRNLPGVIATVQPSGGAKARHAILWGGSIRRNGDRIPWPIQIDGRSFQIDLRNCVWDLPFSVRVNRFVHVRHPGMSMPKEFSSYVTQVKGGRATDVHITMNEPLRHEGFTLYQSGWGPPPMEDPNPSRFYTTFSVVANPSDQVPLYACLVIALGLLIHFIRKLVLHLRAETRRREAKPQGATA